VPSVLIGICVLRMLVWLRARRVVLDDRQAVRRLKGVVKLGLGIGVLFLGWYFALFEATQSLGGRMLVLLSIALMTSSCMACLLHLRAASRMLAFTLMCPAAVYMLFDPNLYVVIVGVSMLLVVMAMIVITTITARDFEKMVRLSHENTRLANLDSLTGLPNRRRFFECVETELIARRHDRRPFALGVLDVDGFKSVNDVFGHVTGDQLLVQVGHRMQRVVGDGVMIARLGGDEFGILVLDARDEAALLACGQRICAEINQPITLRDAVVNVSASMGFAVFPVVGDHSELLYERADYALYHAKDKKRGQPVIFSDVHEVEIRQRGRLEQCLRKADLDNELSLHFQPLIDVARGGVPTSFEALARWNSPELGAVSPADFIGVAERSDLIHRITHTLLRRALSAVATWPERIGIAFNLSMRDLVSSDSIATIVQIVRESGVAPGRIEFEITESALMADFNLALQSVQTLRALGTHISLDDFGTGYSSLSHVHRLPLDKIKVDRSFITDIESRATGKDILRTVIDLCQNLNIECVVEGTETAEQIEILKDLGCNMMQGYYFAKPMTIERVEAYLSRGSEIGTALPIVVPSASLDTGSADRSAGAAVTVAASKAAASPA